MKKDYPKMIYKAFAKPPEAKGVLDLDERIGFIIVDSPEEQRKKNKEGWGDLDLQKEKLLKAEKSLIRKEGVKKISKVSYKVLMAAGAIATILVLVIALL